MILGKDLVEPLGSAPPLELLTIIRTERLLRTAGVAMACFAERLLKFMSGEISARALTCWPCFLPPNGGQCQSQAA